MKKFFMTGLALLLAVVMPVASRADHLENYNCFPTCDETDARFLTCAGDGVETIVASVLDLKLAAIAGATDLEIGIFDGNARGRWDLNWENPDGTKNAVEMRYEVFADQDGDGIPNDSDDDGTPDPPLASHTSQEMPDNAWFDIPVTLPVLASQAPSGNFFFVLRMTATAGVPSESFKSLNNFKVRSDQLVIIPPNLFSFIGALHKGADGRDIYESWPAIPDDIVPGDTRTTYDGTWDFHFLVPASIQQEDGTFEAPDRVDLWDGDFDYGSQDCSDRDMDDPDTTTDIPDWALGTGIRPEGVAFGTINCTNGSGVSATGDPPDDWDIVTWPFNKPFLREPSVVYSVVDPLGNHVDNDNPSGNREIEQFLIETDTSVPADHYVQAITPGIWHFHSLGLDLSNLNAIRFAYDLLCVDTFNVPCEPVYQYRIGDTVFEDLDSSGTQEPGEPGIPGVLVNLLDSLGNVLETTVTDADGKYFFEVPPGTYTVQVDPANFMLVPPAGAIGNRVWFDADGDGVQDGGEAGIPGVTVRLFSFGPDGLFGTPDDVLLGMTMTDGDGGYWFPDLALGSYYTAVDDTTLPEGLALTGGSDPSAVAVVTAIDPVIDTLDFGYRKVVAEVGDVVWLDVDGNGVQDAGEPGIGGVTVDLIDVGGDGALGGGDDSVAATTLTVGGHYLFTGVAPGNYVVDVTDTSSVLVGYGLTTANDPTAVFSVAAGDVILDKDFGYEAGGASTVVGDFVWFDIDGDGVQDAGEPGIDGVTVDLIDVGGDGVLGGGDDSVVDTTTTVDGSYLFTGMAAGDYVVDVTDTVGVLTGYGLTTANDPTAVFAVATGDVILDKDFGYDTGLYSIADTVWFDADRDGEKDAIPGEPGIDGVTVLLLDAAGEIIGSTVTAGGGMFSFGDLPNGEYTIYISDTALVLNGLLPTTDPAVVGMLEVEIDDGDVSGVNFGYVNEGALVGVIATTPSPEQTDTVVDDNVLTYDFGYFREQGETGSIGDRVWNDLNGDGVQDDGEPGIPGVTVTLQSPQGTMTTTTDDMGMYLFENVDPGSYTVTVDPATLPECCICDDVCDDDGDSDSDSDSDSDCDSDSGSGGRQAGEFVLCDSIPPVEGCGECDGKVTELTLQYNGSAAADIVVEQKKDGAVVFDGNVPAGGLFSFVGSWKKGTLGTEIRIYVNGEFSTKIHTSCSQDIGPGMVFGEFFVVEGASLNGGPLCPPGENGEDSDSDSDSGGSSGSGGCTVVAGSFLVPTYDLDDPTPPILTPDSASFFLDVSRDDVDFGYVCFSDPVQDCGECDGKVTELTLQYNGPAAADIVVEQKKDGAVVFDGNVPAGGLLSFVGSWKKGTLGTEIRIYVNGDFSTKIHTSCSQDIGPGMVFGEFFVVEGASRNGGPLCPPGENLEDSDSDSK